MGKRFVTYLKLLLLAGLLFSPSPIAAQTPSDSEIASQLIAASRAVYPGPCACPYDTDRRGHLCGERSAYSKPGGWEPLCYESDVTPDLIYKYRANKR